MAAKKATKKATKKAPPKRRAPPKKAPAARASDKARPALRLAAALGKKFGSRVLTVSDDQKALAQIHEFIPSGVDVLDNYVIGRGGYPVGRMSEVFGEEGCGKTALAMHSLASVQRVGGIAVLADAEQSFDAERAEAFGIDLDELVLLQPANLEELFEMAKETLRMHNPRNGPMMLAWDSIASTRTKHGLISEAGVKRVGDVPLLMSEELPKILQLLPAHRAHMMMINQVRAKIGVVFGCFSYDTKVSLANGGTERIGKIVNDKAHVEVLAMDPATGIIVPKRVIGWHDNGNAEYFLRFTVQRSGGTPGPSMFSATPNHQVFCWTGREWEGRDAERIAVGDLVAQQALQQFTPIQRQVAIGSVLGDGSLRARHGVASLRIGHGADQDDYCVWKESLFEGCIGWSGRNSVGGRSFDCRPSVDLAKIFEESYRDGKRALSKTVLQELTIIGVAIWCLDDGSFSGSYERWGHGKFEISAKIYTHYERTLLAARLAELGCGLPTVRDNGNLLWSGERTKQLHDAIAPYVPLSMEYKLHPNARGRFVDFNDAEEQVDAYVAVPSPVLDIREKPPTRSMRKFDLTVEDLHTYLVSGVAVHNSNVTTPGGNAPKFYSSLRLQFFGGKAVKVNDMHVAKIVTVMAVKNRLRAPFAKARVRFDYATGYNNMYSTVEHAKSAGLIKPREDGFKGKGKAGAAAYAEAMDRLGWKRRLDECEPQGIQAAGFEVDDGDEEDAQEEEEDATPDQ